MTNLLKSPEIKSLLGFFIIAAIPSVVEAYLDRFGESKHGKVKDFYWFVAASIVISLVGWLFHLNPLKILVLILAWRILIFDYLVAYLLIRNGVIVGKWWSYSGESTYWWDQLVSRVNPWLRLLIRVILFAGSLFWFLL